MKNFVLPIPADFLGQLFIRKAIVEALKHENELSIPKKIIHLLLFLDPLHISLNTRESIFLTFHLFFNHLYKIIFGKKKTWLQNLNLGALTYCYTWHMQDG